MSVTKIIFKQGPNTPSGTQQSNPFNTVGEPLWDSVHKKFYITNGGIHPTLIGPITYTQVQANWNETDTNSPAFIQNKPDDRNDNIQVNIDNPSEITENVWAFTTYNVKTTQYVADIDEAIAATHAVAPFFDLGSILDTIDSSADRPKKTTLFVKNAHFCAHPASEYEDHKLPLFWYYNKEGDKLGTYKTDFKMNFYINGALEVDGSNPVFDDNSYTEYGANEFYAKINNKFAGDILKFEIYLKDKESLEWDINLTWPVLDTLSVTALYNSLTGIPIATLNNTTIYCPVSAQGGTMMITGTDGVQTVGNTYTVRASLDSYSTVTGNLTPVALKANGINPRTLVVKENSLFDDDSGSDAATIDDSDISNGNLSWKVNPSRRSYRSYEITTTPQGNAIKVSGEIPSDAECTDHYLFLINSTNSPIQISFDIPSSGAASGAVRAVPAPMYVKVGSSIEISLIYKYESASLKTVVMTASEGLIILQ